MKIEAHMSYIKVLRVSFFLKSVTLMLCLMDFNIRVMWLILGKHPAFSSRLPVFGKSPIVMFC